MNRFVQAAIGCALMVTPMSALADSCVSSSPTHEVRVQFRGFFPSTLYACPGDTIYFVNKTGRSIDFEVQDPNGDSYSYIKKWTWVGNGTTLSYVIPAGYDYLRLGDIVTHGASNYPWDGFVRFESAPTG